MAGMNKISKELCFVLLKMLSPKYAALFALGIGTGGRVSELINIRRGQLEDEHKNLRSPVILSKLKSRRKRSREIYIPEIFKPYILTWLKMEWNRGQIFKDSWVFRGKDGNHLSRFTVYSQLKIAFAKVGLHQRYATHSMRKTFADGIFTTLCAELDPMSALEHTRQALGHDRIDNTVKYLGIRETSVKAAQNKFWEDNYE